MSPSPGSTGRRVEVRWIGVASVVELQRIASSRILGAAARTIEVRSKFLIVLSGGDTPRDVYRSLRTADTDWSRWHIYFSDERCVPPDDLRRNSKMAADEWLDHVAIPRSQIHVIPGELGASVGADAYAKTLRDVSDFDLVLLGLGDDGHTASLFEGHEWGESTDAPDALAVFDAPKPPPERVTLSVVRLNRTRETLFLVAGGSKHDALARWHAGQPIPAAALAPAGGVDVLVTPPPYFAA